MSMDRSLALAFLLVWGAAVSAEERPAKTRPPLLLPGVDKEGAVRLHNQWSLRPAGKQLELGDFPVNLALHPGGKWLAVLHAGFTTHEIVIVDLHDAKRQKITCRVPLDQTFYGLCFAPDGKQLFASGGEFEVVHVFDFDEGLLARRRKLDAAEPKQTFVVGGLAVDPAGQWLFAAGTWGHAVSLLPLTASAKRLTLALPKDSYPYACTVDAGRKRLYVSLWGKAAIAVIDLQKKEVVATFRTEPHPTEMVLSPGGKALYVACANSTRVSVLNPDGGKGLETISCALHPKAPAGNTPNSLSLTPDGQLLFVANADANNVAVFNVTEPGKAQPLGFIPTGLYPTSVRFNPADKRLYIANCRGATPKANRQGPNPLLPKNQTVREYIGALYRGSLSILEAPTEERMTIYSELAHLCSPLRADQGVTALPPNDSPIPARVGLPSPIKHCIYIIRENRTYDQVFGDLKEGNGDPTLCIFPEKITPNAHRLARQFVLLDNFYCEGEVSADGHEWSMGAYCTDFIKKVWPLNYRGSPHKKLDKYPSDGNYDPIGRPAEGYIWDRCAEAGLSYRSYGEFIKKGKTPKDPGTANVKALEGHFDPWYRPYDLDYPDQKRADRFIEELQRFEREGKLPQFTVIHLPNDHTYGTRLGKPTPTAMVADNDLALGRVVEAITKSKFWNETAIFVVEDDAQNGSDHVDAHRTVALVISPYTRHGQVDSTLYSTSSMLRTMELILGLRPMSQFDAAARPMYHAFQAKPDPRPYQHAVPDTDLKAKNPATAWGTDLSEKFDFSKQDLADDLLFNEVIWRSVRGADSPMPPPVRAAFVFPYLKEE
jgi:DNA-binding beta-propeller fold protein YncE